MFSDVAAARRVHYIGIGGAGMSALAALDLARGYLVSGSDAQASEVTSRLERMGANVAAGHSAGAIGRHAPDLVVTTAAVPISNPEVTEAQRRGIPVVSRATYLGQMMDEHAGPRIAVTGTHGKTTVTSMLSSILLAAGTDPTLLIGADWPPIGGNVRVGRSGWFLTEACEAYESFLALRPDAALVTNAEADHLDHYGSAEAVEAAFVRFVQSVRAGGVVVGCGDDPGARRVLEASERNGVFYGLESESPRGYLGKLVPSTGFQTLAVRRLDGGSERELGVIRLTVSGRHNALNALGAASLALELGIGFEDVKQGLERFRGAERRFEILGEREGVLVIDDYAHHPTEIAATLQAARADYPDRKIIAIFQPHLYSRTRDFLDKFAATLSEADAVIVTDVYAAREPFDPLVRIPDLVHRVAAHKPEATVLYVGRKEDVPAALAWVSKPGDLALVMGAGDIREAAEAFLRLPKPGGN